jgi:hypothetical protein
MTLKEEIIELLEERTGLSDREITDELRGKGAAQQPINQACIDLGPNPAAHGRPHNQV